MKKIKDIWSYQYTPAIIFILVSFLYVVYDFYSDIQKAKTNPKPRVEHSTKYQDDQPRDCEYDAYHGWSCN